MNVLIYKKTGFSFYLPNPGYKYGGRVYTLKKKSIINIEGVYKRSRQSEKYGIVEYKNREKE